MQKQQKSKTSVFFGKLCIKSISAGAFFTAYIYWGLVISWQINTDFAIILYIIAGILTTFMLWEQKFSSFITGCAISFAVSLAFRYIYVDSDFLDKFYRIIFGYETPNAVERAVYGINVMFQLGAFVIGLFICFCIAVTGSFGYNEKSDDEKNFKIKLRNVQFVISVIMLIATVLLTVWQSGYTP